MKMKMIGKVGSSGRCQGVCDTGSNAELDWVDETALTHTTYYYKVKAVGFYGSSVLSNEVHSFPSNDGEAPDVPTGLQGSAIGNAVHLTWDFPDYLGTANYIQFQVYSDNGSGEWIYNGHVEGFPGTSAVFDREVVPGTYHYLP